MNYLLVVQVFVRTPLAAQPAQFSVKTNRESKMRGDSVGNMWEEAEFELVLPSASSPFPIPG
ncbi:hypothetical protein, partial [Brucella sp. 22210]|uniref:hypothetical protein n=1 Tax=Brucella sp. 22210 TaxID=3453892 RepID=UPI003F853F51